MSDMAVEVPEDLITDILQFSPAKTLLRFRCVSKSLLRVIDSPDFIKTHLARVSDSETHRKIIVQDDMQLDRFNPVPVHVFHIDYPIPPELRGGNSKGFNPFRHSNNVYAQCNGLVVLEQDPINHPFSLVVWNPTTRKCWKLPVLPTEVPEDPHGNRIKGLCFGYDSSVDNYKVIIIKERTIADFEWDDGDYDTSEIYEIWILGLKSGYWRKIKHPCKRGDDTTRNCFVDGAFYFNCHKIFAFDLAKETFSRVSLPVQTDRVNLNVLEGCLSACFYFDGTSSKSESLKLYLRKKNDAGEFFWTKLFSIKLSNAELSCQRIGGRLHQKISPWDLYLLFEGEFLGLSKEQDKIYVLYDKRDVYSYDFKKKKMKRMLAVDDKNTQRMMSCIESLVWIKVKDKEKKRKRYEKKKKAMLNHVFFKKFSNKFK